MKSKDATMEFDYASFTRYDIDALFDMSLPERATWHAEWSEILLACVDLGVSPATAATIAAAHVHAQLASAWAAIASVCPSTVRRGPQFE
jgi:hypothetical protein